MSVRKGHSEKKLCMTGHTAMPIMRVSCVPGRKNLWEN